MGSNINNSSSSTPWLDNLSDDWIPEPGTPSPVPTRPKSHSRRRSSLQSLQTQNLQSPQQQQQPPSSPSRIPLPARGQRSRVQKESPADDKKRITRPCHFIRREPPTPKGPSTPRTPSKLRSPVPGTNSPRSASTSKSPGTSTTPKSVASSKSGKSPKSTVNSPKPNAPAARQNTKSSAVDTRSPLRSVSNMSSQSTQYSQQDTVQVRPKKTKTKESTPEWRKRLVNGEVPHGEQRDLFAPIGLESVFKPPTPRSEGSQQEQIPMMRDSDDLWNFEDDEHREDDQPVENASGSRKGKEPISQRAKRASGTQKSTASSRSTSQQGSLKVKKGPEDRQNNDQLFNDTQLRTASGLEDLRNEGITPITFSQTNSLDGNGTSEVIKSALKRVTDQLGHLSLSPGERPGSRASDSALLEPQDEEVANEVQPEDELLDVTSNSLPQDLSMGTLDHTGHLAFAKFRRTGYLNDGTLLKTRLTPSPFPSQRLSPGTFGNSRIRSSPPVFLKTNPLTDPPTLPRPSSARSRNSLRDRRSRARDEGMPSSGSPLKLFGDHDTFTNNRLLRRMSQFEETFGGSDEDEPVSPSEEARRKGENRSFLNVKPYERSSLYSSRRSKTRGAVNPKLNQFGDGGLDNFDFSDTSPYEPKLLYNEIPDSEYRPSSERRSSDRRQFRSSQNSNNSEYDRTGLAEDNSFGFVEVKPSSAVPEREKNAKRRRTLLRSVSPESQNGQDSDLPEQPDHLSLLQRSLKQHGIDETDSKFLAQPRSVQRPRSPTPSQSRVSTRKRSSSRREDSKLGSNAPSDGKTPEMEVPRVKVTGANDERRKGSITTQDYLTEATRIMDMIRSKGKSPGGGGLPSLEEIDLEEGNDDDEDEDEEDDDKSYDEESTRDEFSRPPSREGVDLRKLREPSKEPNPRILSHLKKFQENDDPEYGVSASVASLRLSHGQPGSIRHVNTGPTSAATRKQSLGSLADCDSIEDLLANTQLSSTGIPTGSSQGSHAKGVLSSDMVSHLIPEQVNGFTYDRSRKQWVKEKVRPSSAKPKGEDSEDDPFLDIPDLSVDELQEMMRIQSSSSPIKQEDFTLNEDKNGDHKSSQPATRTTAPSTLQSRLSRLNSGETDSGTRATSWDTQERHPSKEPSSEVEHEIQLNKGRLSKPPRKQQDSNQQARVVTISFSSPLVSQVAYSDDHTPTKYTRNEKTADDENDEEQQQPGEQSPTLPEPEDSDEDELSGKHSIPEIGEEDGEEERDDSGDLRVTRQDNSHLAVSTPFHGDQYNSLAHLRAGEHDTSYSFHLSPLPDFTVNEIDQPLQLELSYVAQRTHPTSLREIHGTFALATEDLVKRITEVEPFEPYWEHVRRLILRDKGLITLNKLNEFCPRLEDLDVSDNHIGHLSGVPATLRTLRIQRNFLSNLTAWGHLTNLQYLDVSGNGLESLDGFNSLIHLREIKANDNNIQNIDGIMELNGLLSLKLSNNALKEVDFTGSELTRLSELDLSNNELTSVKGLSSLPSLSALNLGANHISDVDFSETMSCLRSLKLSNNELYAMDTAMLPALNLLYLDHNSLSTVSGLENCPSLEILSAREQSSEDFGIDLGLVRDIRKVFLSSNRLSAQTMLPSAPLLSLQLLDFASCKIDRLPKEFALNFPNVKVLNLNFNALTGVGELAGMNCLSRLGVAGNRITRMRKLCQVLSRVGRASQNSVCSLHKVDIRGNPLTVRFYPPPLTGSGKDPENKKLRGKGPGRIDNGSKDVNNLAATLAGIGRDANEDIAHPALWDTEDDHKNTEIEINDPYTLPSADPMSDTKYFTNLDEPTRLRRRVLELMIYAGTGGSVKYLDGLELQPKLEEGSDMDRAWTRLEKLGVLKRKAITN